MICFGAKTDQEVKEKGTFGSHFKINKKNKIKTKQVVPREKQSIRDFFFFSRFSL